MPVKPAAGKSKSKAQKSKDWIELFPHGISVGSDLGRPVLVLKDKNGIEVLPVWMHPLDAGVALAELSNSSGNSPHAATRRVLERLDVKLESCTFVDLVGHHQFVELALSPLNKTLRVRADEAMSLCLQARARFFSRREYMLRCRDLDADLTQMEQNLTQQGHSVDRQSEMEISSKKHPYVM